MLKQSLAIVLFLITYLFNPTAFASQWECGENLKALIQTLNLTPVQKEQVEPILVNLSSIVKTKAADLDVIDQKIDKQVYSGTIDDSITLEVDNKTQLIGDIIKAKLMAKKQLFALLDDKQKTLLQQKMKQLQDKFTAKYKQCH